MEFRLLYSGNQLFANGSAAQKHLIRRTFHPQLKQLWKSNPNLRKMALVRGVYNVGSTAKRGDRDFDDKARVAYFDRVGADNQRGKFRFIPLIDEKTCLRVSIDILFLRRDQHPFIIAGGDIDNRLKTLFDALRVPSSVNGLGNPKNGEDPFFVLLEDDKLISEIRVNTDNILLLPNKARAYSRDVFLVINVKVTPTERTAYSIAFE